MAGVDALIVRVQPSADDDDSGLAGMTQRLRAQLLELDVDSVDPVAGPAAPAGAKGLETVFGWLAVHLGQEGLRKVIGAVVSWATREGHDVELTLNGDTLKVSNATSAQQERMIDQFLELHKSRG
jgi:hypothetical protein